MSDTTLNNSGFIHLWKFYSLIIFFCKCDLWFIKYAELKVSKTVLGSVIRTKCIHLWCECSYLYLKIKREYQCDNSTFNIKQEVRSSNQKMRNYA